LFHRRFSNVNSSTFQGSNTSDPNNQSHSRQDFYIIDADHGFFVENDLLEQGTPRHPIDITPAAAMSSQAVSSSFEITAGADLPHSALLSQPKRTGNAATTTLSSIAVAEASP